MERLGTPLDRCSAYGWGNVAAYARHLAADPGSYIWRAEHEDEYNYASPLQLAAMLADVYDLIHGIGVALTTRKGRTPRRPKPYPRPWAKSDAERIGKGAIPVSEFEKWYYGGD